MILAAISGLPPRVLILGGLLAWMTTLQGCGCTHPEPHLVWRPDANTFNERTNRIVDGIWRGNPSWVWSPELESEDYQCVAERGTSNLCVSWTSHEWNCGEHDFGMCKCYEMSSNEEYCEKWSCHSLEADQQICAWRQGENGETEECHYSPFYMNYDTYNTLMERQAGGGLTTGEVSYDRWWAPTSLWSADIGRRLAEEEEVEILRDYVSYLRQTNSSEVDRLERMGVSVEPRQLYTGSSWPPTFAYSPVARHVYFWWGDVCIVNGDNAHVAKRQCHQWREIETEIQMCQCREADVSGKACSRWTCEDRDVGLFSVLFRTQQSIDQYTEGVEFESYKCTRTSIDGHCMAWQGDISSLEEVEWSTCECSDSTCNRLGAVWICDEWELPKTRDLFFEDHIGGLCVFIFLEVAFGVFLLQSCSDSDGDVLFVVTGISWCVGLIMLPFLVLTFGLYGFLFAGSLFWFCRSGCCCVLCIMHCKLPEFERAQRPTNRARMQRGASKMLGRQTSSVTPAVAKEEETNQANNEPSNMVS